MAYSATYIDNNGARNTTTLTAKTTAGAKRQAITYAPALAHILLYDNERHIATRKF